MTDKEIQLKDKIVQQAIKSVRRDKKVDVVSLLSISKAVSYTHLTLPTNREV